MARLLIITVLSLAFFSMCREPSSSFVPNARQKEWLASNEVAIGIYPFYPPYAYLEERNHIVGLFPDLQKIVSETTGLQFRQVFYPSWHHYLAAAKRGEIDIINPIIPTPDRRNHLLFTKTIVMDPHVIVGPEIGDVPGSVEALAQREDIVIATVEAYFIAGFIRENFPNHRIQYYADDSECMRAVHNGDADVFMTQKYTGNFFLKQYPDLKILSDIPSNTMLSIGVHESQPQLFEIISGAIDGISEDDMAQLINKWSYQYYLPVYRKASFWVVIGVGALVVVLLLLVWNKVLTIKVRQRTAELLSAKEKAEESDRLKTAFVSNISHEIRTPLNAINGYAELLALQYPDSSINRFSSEIIASSHRLTTIIEGIVLFARLEQSRILLHEQERILADLISAVVAKVAEMYPAKKSKVTIKTEFENDKQIISVDPYYFQKMLFFVIDNALKFTVKGTVTIGWVYKNAKIVIFVEDTGAGISAELLPGIFDKFYKFSASKDRFFPGTGIGLTISKKLADMLGFDLDGHSEMGKGSTFYFVQRHAKA
ncbi:MAG: transporter substrate-binding domain-containing protein [Salinivirgaceae bacterium]|jgi:signal transduction histidine kinase|nr:transporter substrate-binding domain-containing protein [Salinivirgaceae bacterium]